MSPFAAARQVVDLRPHTRLVSQVARRLPLGAVQSGADVSTASARRNPPRLQHHRRIDGPRTSKSMNARAARAPPATTPTTRRTDHNTQAASADHPRTLSDPPLPSVHSRPDAPNRQVVMEPRTAATPLSRLDQKAHCPFPHHHCPKGPTS